MWNRARSRSGRVWGAALAALAAFAACSILAPASPADSLRSDGVRVVGSSADAREVFFLSPDRLVPADRDNGGDLYESAGRRLSLLATGDGEPGGAEDASFRYVTPDGKRVFFQTAKPLTPNDTDSAIDVYERAPEGLTLVSTGPADSNGPQPARFQAASPDGQHVVFATTAALTPDDSDGAVDLYERSGGTTTLVTKGTAQGVVAVNREQRETFGVPHQRAVLSDDGSRVVFATAERLSPSDHDDQIDLYEASGGAVALLSTGPADDGSCPATDCDAELESASPDASRIVFDTREALVPGDVDGANDLYERAGGTTTLLSVGASGQDVSFPEFLDASTDASRVLFASADKLTADDRDRYPDVFERAAGATRLVSGGRLDTSFPGATAPGVEFAGASADLSHVFFTTYEGLIPSDRQNDLDLYENVGSRTTLVSGTARAPNDQNSTIRFEGCSANGRTVVFLIESSLLPADRGHTRDLYARTGNRLTLMTRGAGHQGGGPRVLALSADGKRVVFASVARLARQDHDRRRDLYEWFRGRVRLLSGPSAS
jgi:Tol biopolymer transport system component